MITHLQQKIQKLEETVRHYDKRLKSYQSEDEEMMAARPNYQRKNSIAESYEKAELLEQISQLQNRLTEKTIEVEQMSGKLNNLQSELQEKSQTIIEMVHRSNSQNTKRLTNGIEERLGKSHFRSSNSLGSDSSIVNSFKIFRFRSYCLMRFRCP